MLESFDEKKTKIITYSIPTIIVFIFAAAVPVTSYSKNIWVHIPFHSAIEATGAIVALILSALLLTSKNEYPLDCFKVITASALITMGVLDLFHATAMPGQTFVWLHSIATFGGGVLFSLVWLPKRILCNPLKFPIACLIISLCFAFLSILYPEKIPIMLQGNDFASAAEVLNLVGGFGFFLGAAWFFRNYYHSTNTKHILFANLCLLFGMSAVIFDFSTIWDTEWWIWHTTRLIAYFVALLSIFAIYKNIEKQKENIFIELEDALKNIKVLKGFLPICASCKNIRDDKGYWQQIESYIRDHSEAEFSHGICPECSEKLYPDLATQSKEE